MTANTPISETSTESTKPQRPKSFIAGKFSKSRNVFKDLIKAGITSFKKVQASALCDVCNGELLVNNISQVVHYCSKRCRLFRHNRNSQRQLRRVLCHS